MSASIPAGLQDAIAADPRVVTASVYLSGWVPTRYKWPAPGAMLVGARGADGAWSWTEARYDRKRAFGCGPKWVAFSAKGGRLASL